MENSFIPQMLEWSSCCKIYMFWLNQNNSEVWTTLYTKTPHNMTNLEATQQLAFS